MTSFPQSNPAQPAPRLKLDGSVPVALRVEGTTSVRGKLRELSATGGLLVLAKPLDKGEFVELAFPTNNGSVQGMAEIDRDIRKCSPPKTLSIRRPSPWR